MTKSALIFGFALLTYILILIISLKWLNGAEVNQPLKIGITLLPVAACVFVAFSIVHCIVQLDELQRRIQFNAVACAFVITALSTFSYGFLENIGLPKLSMFAVWPFMATIWAMGVLYWSWVYR